MVQVGRLVTEILLNRREAGCTERGVVPQDIDDVRRPAIFLTERVQFLDRISKPEVTEEEFVESSDGEPGLDAEDEVPF